MPVQRLEPDRSLFLIVDVQDKLLAAMPQSQSLVHNIAFLIDVARLLGVPVLATEQYPKGLGPTTASIASKIDVPIPAKTSFSCFGAAGFRESLERLGRRQIVVTGMEAHVCILQTVLDLIDAGYTVFLAEDAVRSRFESDRQTALRRMQMAGAIPSSVETVAFEWTGDAQHPQFKAISALVRARPPA